MSQQIISFAPQAGPQYDFMSTLADICIFGGQAGGGKTFGLLLEPIRHFENPAFGGVIFRKFDRPQGIFSEPSGSRSFPIDPLKSLP
jgi:hypothetical protein